MPVYVLDAGATSSRSVSVAGVSSHSYEVTAESAGASPEVVFAILADSSRWRRVDGPDDPPARLSGAGGHTAARWRRRAIKKVGGWPVFSREETVEYDPRPAGTRTRSCPARPPGTTGDCRADAARRRDRAPSAGRRSFDPKIPGTGAARPAVSSNATITGAWPSACRSTRSPSCCTRSGGSAPHHLVSAHPSGRIGGSRTEHHLVDGPRSRYAPAPVSGRRSKRRLPRTPGQREMTSEGGRSLGRVHPSRGGGRVRQPAQPPSSKAGTGSWSTRCPKVRHRGPERSHGARGLPASSSTAATTVLRVDRAEKSQRDGHSPCQPPHPSIGGTIQRPRRFARTSGGSATATKSPRHQRKGRVCRPAPAAGAAADRARRGWANWRTRWRSPGNRTFTTSV